MNENILKYLEVPDLHFDPSWIDITEEIVKTIIREGIKNLIDFVAMPGDIINRAIIASEQGGLNKLRYLILMLTSHFPVCAVYGTPGHEPEGSLKNLEDIDLVILKPNNTYGFFKKERKIKLVNSGDPLDLACILFGINELSNKKIQAKYKLTAEEANAKTLEELEKYVKSYIAPMRMKYDDLPAIGLLHGVVSDSKRENESDIIKKSSSLLIHSEILGYANLNRWTFGDIHTPWESKIISGGYAGFTGIDNNPFGKTGFKPSMNLVEILNGKPKISRIPYGTPERRKITDSKMATDKDIAYFLETKDKEAKLPEFVHPWSKVVYKPEKKTSQRVSAEDYANIKSLEDLFRIIDPKVSKSIIDKVNELESKVSTVDHKKIDAVLDDVEIYGCDLFHGETVKFKISELNDNLTGIFGDNGEGKSSLFCFSSFYPVIIGKDTDSGRASAIKDFFHYPGGKIIKRGTLNGVNHEHVITIEGSHTQNPKVKCNLIIDGESVLEKGTFDDMFSMCEELYGNFNDYLLTSFYIQPHQSTKNKNLIDATLTDIRNLVQSIAGVDRENEKQHALNKVSEIRKELVKLDNWMLGVSEFKIDVNSISLLIESLELQKSEKQNQIDSVKSKLNENEIEYKKALHVKSESDSQKAIKESDEEEIKKLENTIVNKKTEIEKLKILSDSLNENIKKLNNNKDNIVWNEVIKKTKSENEEKERKYKNAVEDENKRVDKINEAAEKEYNSYKETYESSINAIKNAIESNKNIINSLNNPCVNCGYIDSESKDKIKNLEELNKNNESELSIYSDKLSKLTKPALVFPNPVKKPELKKLIETEPRPVLSDSDLNILESNIESGRNAKAYIDSALEFIGNSQRSIKILKSKTYNINDGIQLEVEGLETVKDGLDHNMATCLHDIANINATIKSNNEKIDKYNEISSKIETKKKEIKELSDQLSDWDYIAKMLQPSKIPALELDYVISAIDEEATNIISVYRDGKFSFKTETQTEGKAGTVDRFDIIIFDAENGKERSFLKHSPGEKSFLSDAYTKALIRKRNERLHRRYEPIIMDESDGPIQPEFIEAYYNIQKSYWTDNKVLIVSHSPTSHEFIDQSIKISDLKEKSNE